MRAVAGVTDVDLTLGVMSAEQRAGLKDLLSDGKAQREITFAQPGSLTKVFAIASGKGGVGKSSVTVNLALAMAGQGLKVGLVDADIYGHSVPAMLGVADAKPTQVEDLIMPVPTESGVSVISIGMLKPRRDQVVAWRGPMLDRALVQMLSDSTGATSTSCSSTCRPAPATSRSPSASTSRTPRWSWSRRRRRPPPRWPSAPARWPRCCTSAWSGVVENMSYLPCPHCAAEGEDHRLEVFGSGGGERVAATLSKRFGYDVPLLGQVPLDLALREGGDVGTPIVESHPTSAAAVVLRSIADSLAGRNRGLAGMQLGLTPAGRL